MAHYNFHYKKLMWIFRLHIWMKIQGKASTIKLLMLSKVATLWMHIHETSSVTNLRIHLNARLCYTCWFGVFIRNAIQSKNTIKEDEAKVVVVMQEFQQVGDMYRICKWFFLLSRTSTFEWCEVWCEPHHIHL